MQNNLTIYFVEIIGVETFNFFLLVVLDKW